MRWLLMALMCLTTLCDGCSLFDSIGRAVDKQADQLQPTHGQVRIRGHVSSPLRVLGIGGVIYQGGAEIYGIDGDVTIELDVTNPNNVWVPTTQRPKVTDTSPAP